MAVTDEHELSPELMKILACPICLAAVKQDGDFLVCTGCGTRYRIEEGGIPNMLIEEAVLPEGVSSYKEIEGWKQRQSR